MGATKSKEVILVEKIIVNLLTLNLEYRYSSAGISNSKSLEQIIQDTADELALFVKNYTKDKSFYDCYNNIDIESIPRVILTNNLPLIDALHTDSWGEAFYDDLIDYLESNGIHTTE